MKAAQASRDCLDQRRSGWLEARLLADCSRCAPPVLPATPQASTTSWAGELCKDVLAWHGWLPTAVHASPTPQHNCSLLTSTTPDPLWPCSNFKAADVVNNKEVTLLATYLVELSLVDYNALKVWWRMGWGRGGRWLRGSALLGLARLPCPPPTAHLPASPCLPRSTPTP